MLEGTATESKFAMTLLCGSQDSFTYTVDTISQTSYEENIKARVICINTYIYIHTHILYIYVGKYSDIKKGVLKFNKIVKDEHR